MTSSESRDVANEHGAVSENLFAGVREIGSLVWHGAKAFLGTLALMLISGIIVGVVCAWIVPANIWWRLLIVAVALAVLVVEGVLLGFKQAVAAIIVAGVRRYHLASRVVGLLLEGVTRVAGDRSIEGARRLPLRQAEESLRRVIAPLSAEDSSAGWLRRTVHRRLVRLVGAITLADLRNAAAGQDGVDPAAARERLAATIDTQVERRVLGGARKVTWVVLILTIIALVGIAVAIRVYLQQ